MSKDKRRYVGKIGYCDNAALGIKDIHGKPQKGGHYVYIREVYNDRCNVNVITSLETVRLNRFGSPVLDRFGNVVYDYVQPKIDKVKRGYLYPIPKKDADFPLWSAINLDGNIRGVKIAAIKNIGSKSMKRRHKFFVGKFTKKKAHK